MTDQSHAQVQASTSITTGVSALLKAKTGVTREQIMAFMPAALPEDIKVSDLMHRYWINFASAGDPSGPGLPHWPAFDERAETAMIFDQTPSARPLPHADRIGKLASARLPHPSFRW